MASDLPPSSRHVAHVLYRHMDQRRSCFPGVALLTQETGLNRKTVMGGIQALEAAGLLSVRRRNGAGNQYIGIVETSAADGTGPIDGTSTAEVTGPVSGTSTADGTTPVPPSGPDRSSGRDSNQPITNQRTSQLSSDRPTLAVIQGGEIEKPPPGFATWFDAWWEAYPKKSGKKPVQAKWKARKLEQKGRLLLTDVINRSATCTKWLAGFVPNPLTYINQDRWNDEFESTNRAGVGAGQTFDVDGWARKRVAQLAAARESGASR